MQCLQSPTSSTADDLTSHTHDTAPELAHAQYELSEAWSSLLLVAASNEEVFHLLDHTLHPILLNEILKALESQLLGTTTYSDVVVAIATELSTLYMVLSRKWSSDVKEIGEVVSTFNHILQLASRIDPHRSVEMTVQLYSSLMQLLRNHTSMSHSHSEMYFSCHIPILVPTSCSQGNLEPRFVLGLVTYISETLQNHHLYLTLGSKHRVWDWDTHSDTHSDMPEATASPICRTIWR